MELPASVRELNPLIDQVASGEPPRPGAEMELAVALGLLTPEGELTAAGRAYARPGIGAGPLSRVMSPDRLDAAEQLMAGPLPFQASLRRLLQHIVRRGERLVAPSALGWPDALLHYYLRYLEDLGLIVPIGPFLEVTARGRRASQFQPARPDWPPWRPPVSAPERPPSFQHPVFRYHLVRRACMAMITMRGQRDWVRLQPLLEGPLAVLKPAYTEWLNRFRLSLPRPRRTWEPAVVARFEASIPYPPWFGTWCEALLNVSPDRVVDALAASPALLRDPVRLEDGLPTREAWLAATALAWASRNGFGLLYDWAAEHLALDGIRLPHWTKMHRTLERAGLLVSGTRELSLTIPVVVQPPPGAIWPFAGPDWIGAALLEGGALRLPGPGRRPGRT